MTKLGKSGVAKPWGEAASGAMEAGDPHFAPLGDQARLAVDPTDPADSAPTPVGNEQLVNTVTASTQVGPVIARGGSGNVAVAWVAFGQDGDGAGIYMRVFAPNGNAVTGEARVNEATAGTQNAPSITRLDNGNFVVAWQERVVLNPPPQSTFLDQVHYRVYSPNGTAITGELTANSAVHKSEGLPSISGLDGGGFAMSWSVEFDDGRREIFVRTFNNAGVPNANEQFANTSQAGTQTDSRVAGLPGGGYIVAWEDQQGAVTTVRAQRFASNGSPVGGEFAPQAQSGLSERINDVIVLAGGGFVVLLSRTTVVGESGLYARIYDANGVAVGGETTLATGANDNGHELTPLAGGGFAAAWQTAFSQGADVRGRLFDAAGNPISDEFVANQTTSGNQGFVDLVERADGSMVYAWSGNGTGDIDGVFMRAFDVASGPGPIVGDGGPNTLTGTPNDDVLNGLGGDDYLDGGAGADQMSGGTGNDIYIVDNVGDQAIEAGGEGYDVVYTATNFTLAAGQELEGLVPLDFNGTTALVLTGNELANYLIGNAGGNTLNGAGGNDTLEARGGNDTLDGGTGADAMIGGSGDDTYYVDDAGDVVIEAAGQGNDTALTSVSYALLAGQEVETLSALDVNGTAALNLTGNEIANKLIGNAGVNQLNGGAGADVMEGRGGNDTYIVDNAGDVVTESAGNGYDVVYTSSSYTLNDSSEVEGMSTLDWNSTAALNLTGNALANHLIGNAGANVLNGGAGSDALYGRGGADVFVFSSTLGAANVDTIGDMQSGTDKIHLDHNVFAGLGVGALGAGAFVTGTQAGDADDRIIYNSTTGQLFFDADGSGSGAAVLFATLTGSPALAASDFVVI